MKFAVTRVLGLTAVAFSLWSMADAQELVRDISVATGGSVQIVNRSGRVGVRAEAAKEGQTVQSQVKATSDKGVTEKEVSVGGGKGGMLIAVAPADIKKRIDIVVTVPEGTHIRVETEAGAIEAIGSFASVDAKTDTGTIATDVPTTQVSYYFLWTESHPRYLADFDLAEVKEKSGGRFEIRGSYRDDGTAAIRKAKKQKKNDDPAGDPAVETEATVAKKEDKPAPPVSLNFTTARGIVLLNVPPNEVLSDLRERPLTEAAKAIVRSGDGLLMEAIRRASPKYFGDYSRTLPPLRLQPVFSQRAAGRDDPLATLKTASVRVADLQNRSIAGLTANDFEVIENGSQREIVSVERSTAPFNLVLLLDVSGSVENYVNFIRKAARSFVDTVDKNDRISIIIFNDDIKVLSKFTTEKEKLSESLDTFDAGGGTAYYDALAYTISDTLRPLKGERSAIVILTDGDDNRSFLSFDAMAGSIQESGSLIYPLYVPSGLIAAAAMGQDIDPLRKKYMSLSAKSEGEGARLAKISGGVYYPITQIGQIQRAYEDIVLQLRTAYNVTFRSEGSSVAAGATPKLRIRSKRENTFATINSIKPAGGN